MAAEQSSTPRRQINWPNLTTNSLRLLQCELLTEGAIGAFIFALKGLAQQAEPHCTIDPQALPVVGLLGLIIGWNIFEERYHWRPVRNPNSPNR